MTRAEAMAAGLKRYVADKPCKNGHEPIYSVSNYQCCECRRLAEIERYHRSRGNASRAAEPARKQISVERSQEQARASAGAKSARVADTRSAEDKAYAMSVLSLTVPDFLARCEARVRGELCE
jgi:hypothetical protein